MPVTLQLSQEAGVQWSIQCQPELLETHASLLQGDQMEKYKQNGYRINYLIVTLRRGFKHNRKFGFPICEYGSFPPELHTVQVFLVIH